MKNAGHTAAATADQLLKYDSKFSKNDDHWHFSVWRKSKKVCRSFNSRKALEMWLIIYVISENVNCISTATKLNVNEKIKSLNNYARISKTLEWVQLRIRFKATIINAVKTRRWKWLVEIPHCCSKYNRKSGAVGCEAAVTHVSCTFCSNALLARRVMGPPKKMKLGANKVRGANNRLMQTTRSGED